ncbi:solute carrier family 22 member 18 isoform X3 [Manis javanica]|uniref:solute carrier family 22 member 18 isoform X3 n=1 Tax=Manis javanica TaxID=9974 RepID=UPI003C6DB1C7
MQGAEARQGQGQSSGGTGTRGRPWVIPLTYALVALEFTCLFMRFSILPYLSRRLGLDAVTFGYLQTTFGLLQLLGGPMFGRFADQHGARVAFTLSFLGSSAFYLLLAAACSPALPGMAFFWASRLPAVLMHTLPAAQMVIADLSAPKDRPAALARLGLCLGVGAILGSLLGGTLTEACGPQPHRWRICSGCWSHHPTQPPLRTHATERIRRFLSHPVLRAVAAVIQCPAIVALGGNLLGAGLSFTCIPASTKGACEHPQAALPGRPRPGHRAAEQPLLRGSAAPGQRAGLQHGGTGHGTDVQRLPLLPPDARPGLQPVCPQRGYRQHADQGRLGLGHGDHAGPLCFCAAANSDPGPHPGRLPVPQLRRPHLRPCAARRQLPHPPSPLEVARAQEEQRPLTLVSGPRPRPRSKLPEDLFPSDFYKLLRVGQVA